jgi:hypothetical protein
MDEMTKTFLAGVLRHALTVLGGVLVHSGYVDASGANTLVGAGMILGGVAWSWWQKKGAAAAQEELARWKASANTPAAPAPPAGGSK